MSNKIKLMKLIKKIVVDRRIKQRELAVMFETSQPRISTLLAQKHHRFSIEKLLDYLEILGYKVEFEVEYNTRLEKPNITTNVIRVSSKLEQLL